MIEIKHLKKAFGASVPLKDVNTTINDGDVIAVIGPSGTGKSTLLRCINLLETPTEGHIYVDGENITDPKCDINRVRRKLGMVFQSFNLYEHLTVVENCMLAQTSLLKRSRQEAYDKAMDLICSVGLEKQALQYPSQLSGGQKQRAAIARTLSMDPEIILLDEPTSALDPITVGEVENVIHKLKDEGHTMMIVTHSMDFARNIANRVFYMDQGEIYEDGTPEQIFEHPSKELTRLFIKRYTSLEFTVNTQNYSLYENLLKIQEFCKDRNISTQKTHNVCSAFEEACLVYDMYFLADDKTVDFSLEYTYNSDKLILAAKINSVKESDISEHIDDTIEVKLLLHYVKKVSMDMDQSGKWFRYVYEIA